MCSWCLKSKFDQNWIPSFTFHFWHSGTSFGLKSNEIDWIIFLLFVAVYADTRILPFVWIIASLEKMQERYQKQKIQEEYKARNYVMLF